MIDKKRLKHIIRGLRDYRKTARYIKLDLVDFFEAGKLLRKIRSEGNRSFNVNDLKIHWGAILKYKKRAGRKEYVELCGNIFKRNLEELKAKDCIRVCFVTSLETAWSGDHLYRMMETSGKFYPFVAIANAEAEKRSSDSIKNYYVERGLRAFLFREMEDVQADLFIYQNPYPLSDVHSDIRERSTSELCVMIPYAVMFFGNDRENFLESEWFIRSQCIWKFYCYTRFQMEQGKKNNALGELNMVYSGYPKTDSLLTGSFNGSEWDFKKDAEKRILYAPSLYWEYSTFMQSWKLIYGLAKEYSEIAWIFRPHPYLGHTLEREKQIPSIEIYDRYLEDWSELENAHVQFGGDYYDTFMTSDAMIADGTSLISNYQYTGKPLLVLTGKGMKYSEYGKELLSAQYTAFGDDSDGIRAFITNVVLNGKDEKIEKRKQFFDKNLNYFKENGKLASEFIYYDLLNELT